MCVCRNTSPFSFGWRRSTTRGDDRGWITFGGTVAPALARHLAPRRVFLFGSSRSTRSISPLLRALRFFAPVLPNGMLHPPRVMQSLGARWFGASSRAHVQLFADMLAAAFGWE